MVDDSVIRFREGNRYYECKQYLASIRLRIKQMYGPSRGTIATHSLTQSAIINSSSYYFNVQPVSCYEVSAQSMAGSSTLIESTHCPQRSPGHRIQCGILTLSVIGVSCIMYLMSQFVDFKSTFCGEDLEYCPCHRRYRANPIFRGGKSTPLSLCDKVASWNLNVV